MIAGCLLAFMLFTAVLLQDSNANAVQAVDANEIAAVTVAASLQSATAIQAPPRHLAILVMPSLLGPENIATQRDRIGACIETYWRSRLAFGAASQWRLHLFVVQWFGAENLLPLDVQRDDQVNLLRPFGVHNDSYARRVFWAMSEIERQVCATCCLCLFSVSNLRCLYKQTA